MAAKHKPKPLQVHLPEDAHARLGELAQEKGITLSQLTRNALVVYERLQRMEKEGRRVLLVPQEPHDGEESIELVIP